MAPAAIAQGLFTFLFTDIVGSTRLWERAPGAARQALARHYEIIGAAIAADRGEIFKTVGDACCCVFQSPADALRAAIAIQRAIAAESWPHDAGQLQVRIAVHTGEAIAEGGDYFGPTLNRVARLVSIAHGGQILASHATTEIATPLLQAECGFIDLGAHRLKDLTEPQHVFQIVADGLTAEFPPPASLDTRPNNLPSQLSTFVGRQSELQRLRVLLERNRLATIAGVGGIGKTRLALQAAAETITAYADGAWMVRLADIADPALVPQSIASALHVSGVPGQRLEETLAQHLREKSMLLLLDNAEHVLPAAAEMARTLLAACNGLRMLVTSREPLHLAGEQVLRIGALRAQDADELFVSRADLERADGYVHHICEELEGLPLAIELAAGRIGTLTTKQLDARLEAMLPTLASKDASQETRHRTLAATIAWSFRLLNPKEQRFFALLSVFEGGFTIEACEAVAWAGEEDDPAYALLDALVDKSFVTAEPAGDAMRYRLPESLHAFARVQLEEFGESAMAGDLHFAYYRSIADRWGTWSSPQEERAYLQVLASEMPNLRAALDWGLSGSGRDRAPAFELLLKVAMYWQQHCSIAEARSWFARACAVAGGECSILHAKMLRRAATFATIEDDYAQARDLTQRAAAMFGELNDPAGVAETLHNLAVIEQRSGSEEEAYRLYGEALRLFEDAHHEVGIITALYNLAQTAKQRGDLKSAKSYMERGMSLCTSAQHADRLATFWTLRAEVAMQERALDEAAGALARALDMKRALDDRHDEVEVLCNLAVLAIRRENRRKAREYAKDALRLARDLGVPSLLIGCFEVFAVLQMKSGRMERARRTFAAAKAMRGERGYVYEIMGELRDELAALSDVAPAADAGEAVQRALDDLASAYSL